MGLFPLLLWLSCVTKKYHELRVVSRANGGVEVIEFSVFSCPAKRGSLIYRDLGDVSGFGNPSYRRTKHPY